MLGTVSYFFGGIFAFVVLGLNISMLGTVGYLMYSFSGQFRGVFFVMWLFGYEYYCDYAAIIFALIGGITAAVTAPIQTLL